MTQASDNQAAPIQADPGQQAAGATAQPGGPAAPAQSDQRFYDLRIPRDRVSAELRPMVESGDWGNVLGLAGKGQNYEKEGYGHLRDRMGQDGLTAFGLRDNFDLVAAILAGDVTPDQQGAGAAQPPAAQPPSQAPQQGEYVSAADFDKRLEAHGQQLLDTWTKNQAASTEKTEKKQEERRQFMAAVSEENSAYDDAFKDIGRERKMLKLDLAGVSAEVDPLLDWNVKSAINWAVEKRRKATLDPNDPQYYPKLNAPLTKQEVKYIMPSIKPVILMGLQQAASNEALAQQAANLPAAALTGQGPGGTAVKNRNQMDPEEQKADIMASVKRRMTGGG